jgi:NADPH:quinone reductase-like Zn-dependent oxidoreductase
MRAKAEHLIPLPSAISFEEAAAFGMTFLTAWHMLVTRARIHPGEDVLILSAGAGIAVAGIQIAKLSGCRVIATSSSEEKCRRALEFGADLAINYREKDFCEEVRRLTQKRGVDVVFEHTGSATWDQSVRSLARMGRLVTCGGTTGYEITTNVAYIFQKQLSLIGSNYGTRPEMETLIQLLAERKFRVAIDQVLPLKEAREAHRLVEGRANFGKVVLVPEGG